MFFLLKNEFAENIVNRHTHRAIPPAQHGATLSALD